MNDLIYRQVALRLITKYNGVMDKSVAKRLLMQLPSAQQKPLKYSGDSICIYCMTSDCDGCMYEPMEGWQRGDTDEN